METWRLIFFQAVLCFLALPQTKGEKFFFITKPHLHGNTRPDQIF